MRRFACGFLFITALGAPALAAEEGNVFVREDFETLDDWRPLTFPKIKKQSTYRIERDRDRSMLRADSNGSASGLVYRREFSPYAFPKARWRWKISNTYVRGNAEVKSRDDYPIRVYVIFKYDPEKASLGEKITYGLAKRIYGEYPPQSSLSYVWANRKEPRRILPSPYSDRARMVILEWGEEKAGAWVDEEVNIIEDYRAAFGSDPPAVASLAIMNDSDNTGEASTFWIDLIEVFQ